MKSGCEFSLTWWLGVTFACFFLSSLKEAMCEGDWLDSGIHMRAVAVRLAGEIPVKIQKHWSLCRRVWFMSQLCLWTNLDNMTHDSHLKCPPYGCKRDSPFFPVHKSLASLLPYQRIDEYNNRHVGENVGLPFRVFGLLWVFGCCETHVKQKSCSKMRITICNHHERKGQQLPKEWRIQLCSKWRRYDICNRRMRLYQYLLLVISWDAIVISTRIPHLKAFLALQVLKTQTPSLLANGLLRLSSRRWFWLPGTLDWHLWERQKAGKAWP